MQLIDQAIAETVAQHRQSLRGLARCSCQFVHPDSAQEQDAHLIELLKSAWRQATTIETLDQLRAIPAPGPDSLNGALIRPTGIATLGGVFELNTDGTWSDHDQPERGQVADDDIDLPAILIWMSDDLEVPPALRTPR